MPIALEDLVGLNRTLVHDLPVVDGEATAARLLANAGGRRLSLAGMHHSQGGHTAIEDGRVLLTEAMNERIEVDPVARTVTVDAGVTWSEIHRVLMPHRLCPRVHQSSAHFTVGGSISVNCHGRDPHAGPVSTTVRSLTVLCGDGIVRQASPVVEPDLFRAVVGGYGSCGLILSAELGVIPDQSLRQIGERRTLAALADTLCDLADDKIPASEVALFYGWLHCVPGAAFYDEALMVKYVPADPAGAAMTLEDQPWGLSEMMRAAWSAARTHSGMRARVWQELLNEFIRNPVCKYRINWMRAAVDFSSHRDERRSDILLEYFLPADQDLASRVRHLGQLFAGRGANVLSTTLRLVRPDTARPFLAYCAGRPMVCMAIDVDIATVRDAAGRRMPDEAARTWVREATAYVLDEGGTYYLPYFGFAGLDVFRRAYSRHGADWQAQQEAIQTYNPHKRFWSAFLDQYLDPQRP